MTHANPPLDLAEHEDIALGHMFDPTNGNLLVFAWDPSIGVRLADEGRLTGMLLTRPPEGDVYQVTRSGIRPESKGLGPRLYQFALLVLDERGEVLQPDNPKTMSWAAADLWRRFPDEWRTGGSTDPLADRYRYAGTSATTAGLRAAQSRGAKDLAEYRKRSGDVEAFRSLMSRSFDVFDAAERARYAMQAQKLKRRLMR